MRHIFDCESIASPKTQKKCLTKVIELAMSLPKGYFYSINVNGSQDRRIRVDVGGTYFDLHFYVWDRECKKKYYIEFLKILMVQKIGIFFTTLQRKRFQNSKKRRLKWNGIGY